MLNPDTKRWMSVFLRRPLHNWSERWKFGLKSAPVPVQSQHQKFKIRSRSKWYSVLISTLCLSCASAKLSAAQVCLVVPAFFVGKAAQVSDMDQIALHFPRELVQKLQDKRAYKVSFHSELPSFDPLSPEPSIKAVQQLSAQYQCPYILIGEIKAAGVYTESLLFGLWDRKWRNFTVATKLIDSRTQHVLGAHEYAQNLKGESSPGRQLNFGGSGFATHPYGRLVMETLNDTLEALIVDLNKLAMNPG